MSDTQTSASVGIVYGELKFNVTSSINEDGDLNFSFSHTLDLDMAKKFYTDVADSEMDDYFRLIEVHVISLNEKISWKSASGVADARFTDFLVDHTFLDYVYETHSQESSKDVPCCDSCSLFFSSQAGKCAAKENLVREGGCGA